MKYLCITYIIYIKMVFLLVDFIFCHNPLFPNLPMVNVNWAVKDLIGGWKDNAHIIQVAKGCSGSKVLMNKYWPIFVNTFGMNMNCPIPPGNYISKGLDLSNITSKTLGLSSFFYGSYKIRISFTDKYNNLRGCLIIVCDVKRPWEKE